jgi:hypothetical protein
MTILTLAAQVASAAQPQASPACDPAMVAMAVAAVQAAPADRQAGVAADALSQICRGVPFEAELRALGTVAPEDVSRLVHVAIEKAGHTWDVTCPGGKAALSSMVATSPDRHGPRLASACSPDWLTPAEREQASFSVGLAVAMVPWLEGVEPDSRKILLRALSGV